MEICSRLAWLGMVAKGPSFPTTEQVSTPDSSSTRRRSNLAAEVRRGRGVVAVAVVRTAWLLSGFASRGDARLAVNEQGGTRMRKRKRKRGGDE